MSPTPELPSLDEIRARVLEIGRRELGRDEDLPEGDLAMHLDSVQRLTLVVAIEDAFEIIFEPEDEEGVQTLSQVVALVHTKLSSPDETREERDGPHPSDGAT